MSERPPQPARDETEPHGPWAGVLLSAVLPGAAHWLNGQRLKAVFWFLLLMALPGSVLMALANASLPSLTPAVLLVVVWVATWAVMLVFSAQPIPRLDAVMWTSLLALGLGSFFLMQSVWLRKVVHIAAAGSNQMAPTIRRTETDGASEADVLVVQRFAYWRKSPERGDIVVFNSEGIEKLPGREYALRIAALPGERVSIRGGRLHINGQPLNSPAFNGRLFLLPADAPVLKDAQSELEVPAGHFFVLADNPEDAFDSRTWGPVPEENILGRVVRICWPSNRARVLR